jgi:hypothetical protein
MAGLRNMSIPFANQSEYIQGWNWSPKLADGSYSTFPVILNNMPWWAAYNEPSNSNSNDPEDSMALSPGGMCTIQSSITNLGVICQFGETDFACMMVWYGYMNECTEISRKLAVGCQKKFKKLWRKPMKSLGYPH